MARARALGAQIRGLGPKVPVEALRPIETEYFAIKEALAGATPYLRIFGIVTGGWLMARQALAARAELDAGSSDSAYLEAKIVTARFYAEQQLPQAAGWVASVKGGAAVLYDVDADQLASV